MIRRTVTIVTTFALMVQPVSATVFINEILLNPKGSGADDLYEYIELMGTPGMRLDGYAIANISGGLTKYFTLNSLNCNTIPQTVEIDEFFSLDGLSIGPNGILVIGIGAVGAHSTLLADTNYRRWTTLWQSNSGDLHGKLQNDGSNTISLVRNRPGLNQVTCPGGNCPDIRWGKDRAIPDSGIVRPVAHDVCVGGGSPGRPCGVATDCIPTATCEPGQVDQFGDGNLDKGEATGFGPPCEFAADLKGASTVGNLADDLEVVDELSYEDGSGWEYDVDGRHVDLNATEPVRFPYRHVHALDDPQGFNADGFSRVDYRTKGPGWDPAPGATGEAAGGTKNWQDTATEQWIRGESVGSDPGDPEPPPPFYYDVTANANPDAIQPFMTHVPLWLNDASGTDFSFTVGSYQIMAGRINPLATAFIPGDTDRDGDCDLDDVTKLSAVFGDADWIFSNSYIEAPEGDSGDPATQTRPWDVDGTGSNYSLGAGTRGIDPTDLQWSLNFQGSTNGRIVGMRYDSTTPTPSGSGVHLNPNTGTGCTVAATAANLCGRPINGLFIGDRVEITVSGTYTSGANLNAGQENGIMQFVQDIAISTGGVLEVVGVDALGAFAKTRSAIESPQGVNGTLGIKRINGYTTSFTQGLSGASNLYRVTLRAIGAGSANVTIAAAADTLFNNAAPRGLKIGHTRNLNVVGANNITTTSVGDPAASSYPAPIAITVTANTAGDVNGDAATNLFDVPVFVDVLLDIDNDPGREQRSDTNCDGVPNAKDIQSFVDLVLP